MIRLLILSVFIQLNCFSQSDHVVIQKEKQTAYYANISGISFGELKYTSIWNEIKVNGNPDIIVSGFKIQYAQTEKKIEGSVIPEAICKEIIQCCSYKGVIFITNITGKRLDGKLIVVNPLSLTLVRND
jgi:hypothetical protein